MVFGPKWGASVQGDSPMYGATWFKEKSETHQKVIIVELTETWVMLEVSQSFCIRKIIIWLLKLLLSF